MKIVIIDGQGGKIGHEIVCGLLRFFPAEDLFCIGTNSAATSNMLKAGGINCATGENPVSVACRDADYIVGPIGIVLVDSMLGEITPSIAAAVSNSRAHKILIPINRCVSVAGVHDSPLADYINTAVEMIRTAAGNAPDRN